MRGDNRFVLAISQFPVSAEHVHSLIDDQFFFGYLVARNREFVFYAPEFSCALLAKAFPRHASRLRVVPDVSNSFTLSYALSSEIEIPAGSRVVFFGYTEKLVTAFLLRHALVSFRLTLIATNNFSAQRVRVYGRRLRAFLRLARLKLDRLVVHTDHELSLVEKLDRVSRKHAMSKRHHLMLPVALSAATVGRPVIAFFGPPKHDKPLEPVADLIAADVGGRFEYRAYGLSEAQAKFLRSRASELTSVLTPAGRLTNQAYAEAVASASMVLLTHSSDFEGKLSGNLCDCIAHAVPFLGSMIEPHLEYLRRFGEIGYVFDMTSRSWASNFLRVFTEEGLQLRRERLLTAAGGFTRDAIYEDLDICLG